MKLLTTMINNRSLLTIYLIYSNDLWEEGSSHERVVWVLMSPPLFEFNFTFGYFLESFLFHNHVSVSPQSRPGALLIIFQEFYTNNGSLDQSVSFHAFDIVQFEIGASLSSISRHNSLIMNVRHGLREDALVWENHDC